MSKLSILKQKNKRDVDMTQGSIFRHLITFAFPLLIGNIFQQLYNTVDTWVVGNYVSNEAFSRAMQKRSTACCSSQNPLSRRITRSFALPSRPICT